MKKAEHSRLPRLNRCVIAFHNNEKMGRSLHDGEPLRLLTKKHVNHLLQNMVWFVTLRASWPR